MATSFSFMLLLVISVSVYVYTCMVGGEGVPGRLKEGIHIESVR